MVHLVTLLAVSLLWLLGQDTHGFSAVTTTATSCRRSLMAPLFLELISFDSEPEPISMLAKNNQKLPKEDEPSGEESRLEDQFPIGSVVQVTAKGIKAFSVPAAACGAFDDDKKTFVPSAEKDVKAKAFLVVPVGLVGEVTKVIDSHLSASHPIQVKFDPEAQTDYKIPVGFTFHFSEKEVKLTTTT
ncbi:expressed unknown protein [Seminavis robusta]|uniref:Uncharacterized protein n=1 Tax=Seminavis robusta TaxID=568900 RepID=A0A9N8DP93_9STRA|nr:expressed unknown protein [Seminavis robusta]|eukprot:Sro165_g073820.1 n/a (187) ;mRNA; r:34671-35231